MVLFSGAFLGALFVSPVVSQSNLVIPSGKGLAAREGNSNHLVPFNPSVAHIQFFYKKSVMGGSPRLIKGFRLRPDGTYTKYRPWKAQTVKNFEVWMGNHPGPYAMDRFSHSGNHPKDRTRVIKPRTISLPAVPFPSKAPDKFLVDLKLDTPFLYRNTQGFYLEIIRDYYDGVYRRWYIDCERDNAHTGDPKGSFKDIGSGCPANFDAFLGRVMQGNGGFLPEPPYPGQTFFTEGTARGKNLPVIGTIGISDKSFGGVPLPFNLGPLGGAGCFLYNNWLLTKVGVTGNTPDGGYRLAWGKIPYDPVFKNALLFHQAVALDRTFNALGLRVSQGIRFRMGPGFDPGLETSCLYGNVWGSFQNYRPTEDLPQFWKKRAAVVRLY